jgi:hypothetical protein
MSVGVEPGKKRCNGSGDTVSTDRTRGSVPLSYIVVGFRSGGLPAAVGGGTTVRACVGVEDAHAGADGGEQFVLVGY